MNLFIPLREASHDNIELRYSLRSITAVFDIDRFILVGHKPSWLQNVEHYPFADLPGLRNKEQNIFRKLEFAFTKADEFLFSNDDYYINAAFDLSTIYHKGTLMNTLCDSKANVYKNSIRNTMFLLQDSNLDRFDFDTHCPLYMNKKDFELSFKDVTFALPCGYLIKSIYCANKDGKYYEDHKLKIAHYKYSWLDEKLFFSSCETALAPAFIKYLDSRWPNKSKFEV